MNATEKRLSKPEIKPLTKSEWAIIEATDPKP